MASSPASRSTTTASAWPSISTANLGYDGSLFEGRGDTFQTLVKLLAKIREEIIQGNVSFLQAVMDFYGASEDEDEDEDEAEASEEEPEAEEEASVQQQQPWHLTIPQLQAECKRRGITYSKSWPKQRLIDALCLPAPSAPAKPGRPQASSAKAPKLSSAARKIVDSLEH